MQISSGVRHLTILQQAIQEGVGVDLGLSARLHLANNLVSPHINRISDEVVEDLFVSNKSIPSFGRKPGVKLPPHQLYLPALRKLHIKAVDTFGVCFIRDTHCPGLVQLDLCLHSSGSKFFLDEECFRFLESLGQNPSPSNLRRFIFDLPPSICSIAAVATFASSSMEYITIVSPIWNETDQRTSLALRNTLGKLSPTNLNLCGMQSRTERFTLEAVDLNRLSNLRIIPE